MDELKNRKINMFICDCCRKPSKPGEKVNFVTVRTKEKEYNYRPKVNKFLKEGKADYTDDNGGSGNEIDIEARLCSECSHLLPESIRAKMGIRDTTREAEERFYKPKSALNNYLKR